MAKTILVFCIFILYSFTANAQYQRFVYSDSFVSTGLSPVSKQFLKKHHTKTITVFHENNGDSMLFKRFLYDTSANLVKEILYAHNGSIASVDSFIYDSQNRKTAQYGKTPTGILYYSLYQYSGSTIQTFSVTVMTDRIDTSFTSELYNDEGKIILRTEKDLKGNPLHNTQYLYNENGTILKMIVNGSAASNYEYDYTHINSGGGRKMILWMNRSGNKIKYIECEYNKNSQCEKCTNFPDPGYSDRFFLPRGWIAV